MEDREKIINQIGSNTQVHKEQSGGELSVAVPGPDLGELSHELAYHKYLLNNDHIRNFLSKLSIPEYLAMHMIKDTEQAAGCDSDRTYLKDIAERMHRTIRQTSVMVKALQERGFLLWSHDGDGSEGTYVTITELGKEMLATEENAIREYYGRVIENYGRGNLMQLLQLMKQLEISMSEEFERMGVPAVESGNEDE